jgi:hypothetical protein
MELLNHSSMKLVNHGSSRIEQADERQTQKSPHAAGSGGDAMDEANVFALETASLERYAADQRAYVLRLGRNQQATSIGLGDAARGENQLRLERGQRRQMELRQTGQGSSAATLTPAGEPLGVLAPLVRDDESPAE